MYLPSSGTTLRTLVAKSELSAREILLTSRGLSVPGNEDLILGLYDENERLVGTGSLVGNVLQGMALAPDRAGEGLSAPLATELLRWGMERGITHFFLFTKPAEAALFTALAFTPVAATERAALLEWGPGDNIRDFCARLSASLPEAPSSASGAAGGGAIVLNANPFTNGHLFLIEQAVKQCDPLHLIVVAEERSLFPFAVRYRLIEENVRALREASRVFVHSGGPYVVSGASFPSYFTRECDLAAVHAELDVTIFATQIAPALAIRTRFVGTEPYCPVTSVYNETMKKILPRFGISLVEIPRTERDGAAVSASTVRAHLRERNLKAVRPLVPDATWDYLNSTASRNVLEAIANAPASRH